MKYLWVTLASMTLALSSWAQDWSALPWTRISRGAADMAMAGSGFMSDANMAWVSNGNAAMIPFSAEKMSAEVGYMRYASMSTNYLNAGFAYNVKDCFGFCAGLSYGMVPAYDSYDENGKVSGRFAPGQLMFGLGASWRFVDCLSAGLNLRYASQSLAENESYSAFAGDFVLMGKFGNFSASFGAVNFGSSIKALDGTKHNLSSSVKIAGMYEGRFSESNGVQVNVDTDYYLAGAVSAALGAQYGWKDTLFARAGYRFSSSACPIPSYASVGLGLKLYGIRFDVAYLLAPEVLRNTVSVGLGYSF